MLPSQFLPGNMLADKPPVGGACYRAAIMTLGHKTEVAITREIPCSDEKFAAQPMQGISRQVIETANVLAWQIEEVA